MIYKIFPVAISMLFSLYNIKSKNSEPSKVQKSETEKSSLSPIDLKIESIYNNLNTNGYDLPKLDCFKEALQGFYEMRAKGLVQKDILTLVDFSLSSNVKRLWVIDLQNNSILHHSLVAHGRNTGEEFANNFSNTSSSFKSSLGFYTTGETYNGKHGMSLKLDGLEKGINDNARARGVVIHAADYVSNAFIKAHKRLGRSQGCPALPADILAEIVHTIKNKSCLFIYHPSQSRTNNSPKLS